MDNPLPPQTPRTPLLPPGSAQPTRNDSLSQLGNFDIQTQVVQDTIQLNKTLIVGSRQLACRDPIAGALTYDQVQRRQWLAHALADAQYAFLGKPSGDLVNANWNHMPPTVAGCHETYRDMIMANADMLDVAYRGLYSDNVNAVLLTNHPASLRWARSDVGKRVLSYTRRIYFLIICPKDMTRWASTGLNPFEPFNLVGECLYGDPHGWDANVLPLPLHGRRGRWVFTHRQAGGHLSSDSWDPVSIIRTVADQNIRPQRIAMSFHCVDEAGSCESMAVPFPDRILERSCDLGSVMAEVRRLVSPELHEVLVLCDRPGQLDVETSEVVKRLTGLCVSTKECLNRAEDRWQTFWTAAADWDSYSGLPRRPFDPDDKYQQMQQAYNESFVTPLADIRLRLIEAEKKIVSRLKSYAQDRPDRPRTEDSVDPGPPPPLHENHPFAIYLKTTHRLCKRLRDRQKGHRRLAAWRRGFYIRRMWSMLRDMIKLHLEMAKAWQRICRARVYAARLDVMPEREYFAQEIADLLDPEVFGETGELDDSSAPRYQVSLQFTEDHRVGSETPTRVYLAPQPARAPLRRRRQQTLPPRTMPGRVPRVDYRKYF